MQDRVAALDIHDLRELAGGASSLTYIGTLAGGDTRRVVVKVAPAGLPPVRNRDVLRQACLLRALHPTGVPVPEVLWEDAGDPPDVPPLFVTSFVDGASFEPLFEDGDANVDIVAERTRDAARTMAALHALDADALGLVGEPVVGPGDELDRWCLLLETVDPTLVPGWEPVALALRASVPAALPDVVVHGDFRLGNMLASGARITAVVDWEIWARSDPRVDVGWFLVNVDPETYRRGTRYVDAMPRPAELAAIYADAGGHDLPDLAWFEALACFKSAATWSAIIKHNRRRPTPDPAIEAMVAALPRLITRADALHRREARD